MELVKIELTNEEGELFKLFRKYQDEFLALVQAGVFELTEGKIVLHKKNKLIQQVELQHKTYIRRRNLNHEAKT